MAREFSGKLTEDDLEYLNSRHTEQYVEYMIGLHGTKGGSKAEEPAEGTEAQDTAANAGDGAGEAEEDLIGSTFDSLGATESEVKDHLGSLEGDALDAEKARILELESSREDREPRKGVVALVS